MSVFTKSSPLQKLTIEAYEDPERENKREGTFPVMFNPESYSMEYKNVYQKYQGINTSGRKARFTMTAPGKLSLNLIIDGTGVTEQLSSVNVDRGLFGEENLGNHFVKVSPGLDYHAFNYSGKNVTNLVKVFLDLTFKMDGDIHEPKYLKVLWGSGLHFNCRLQSVNVNYTLFDRAGDPLRAELDTVFVHDPTPDELQKDVNKNSPDLTHTRIVKKGDDLLSLTREIYDSPAYYIRVARANKIKNFRKLTPGQKIIFPPIKK